MCRKPVFTCISACINFHFKVCNYRMKKYLRICRHNMRRRSMFIDHHSENITKQELQPLCEKHLNKQEAAMFPESHQISASTELQSQTAIKAERIHSVTASPAETGQKPRKVLGMIKDDPAAVRWWCAWWDAPFSRRSHGRKRTLVQKPFVCPYCTVDI